MSEGGEKTQGPGGVPVVQANRETKPVNEPVKEEEKKNEDWLELGSSLSYRCQLPKGVEGRQVELANRCREAKIIADLEGDETVYGFLQSPEDYQKLNEILKSFDTEENKTDVALGGTTFADSRIIHIESSGATMMTCAGLIAGVRGQNAEAGVKEQLKGKVVLLGEQKDKLGQDMPTVVGHKGQVLSIMSVEDYFREHPADPQQLPENLLTKLEEEQVEIDNAAVFDVFKIDIAGSSSTIKDNLGKGEETKKYLEKIAKFLAAFEGEVRTRVEERGDKAFFGQWEGDAVPVYAEAKDLEAIRQAFVAVVDQEDFSDIKARAVAVQLGKASLRLAGGRASLSSEVDMRKYIEKAEKRYKQEENLPKGSVILEKIHDGEGTILKPPGVDPVPYL